MGSGLSGNLFLLGNPYFLLCTLCDDGPTAYAGAVRHAADREVLIPTIIAKGASFSKQKLVSCNAEMIDGERLLDMMYGRYLDVATETD